MVKPQSEAIPETIQNKGNLTLVWVIGQIVSKLLRLEWAHGGRWMKRGGGWKGMESERGKGGTL